jgi:hypothetical protein
MVTYKGEGTGLQPDGNPDECGMAQDCAGDRTSTQGRITPNLGSSIITPQALKQDFQLLLSPAKKWGNGNQRY